MQRRSAMRPLAGVLFAVVAVVVLAGCGGASAESLPRDPAPPTSSPQPDVGCPGVRCVTVALTGDVLVHPPLVQQARTDAGGTTVDFGPMLAAQRDFVAAADLAVCHLETPVAPAEGPFEGYPLFSVPPQVLGGLAGVGYDACTTASNHTLDQGTAGIERTLDALDAAGLAHSGSYRSAGEAAVPLVLDASGARVAVLSATYGLNTGPPDAAWRVDVIDTAQLRADARSAKESGADLVLVALHDGVEYETEPTATQRQRARELLADPAVDLVYGHHAHVVQPLERINGKWVAYGLGNTIAAHETPVPRTREGLLLRVTFTLDGAGRWSTTDLAWVASFQPLDPPHRWCALGAGEVCSGSAADDAAVLARTADAVNLLGADADGARSLLGS